MRRSVFAPHVLRDRAVAEKPRMVTVEPPLARPVFAVGGVVRTWGDVVAAASQWGEWATVVLAAREGLAAAAAGGPDLQSEVWKRANPFRRSLGLLSADDTAAWLRAWGIAVDEWLAHLRRQVLRDQRSAAQSLLVGPDVDGAAWIEGVVSGTLQDTADRLARTLSVHVALGGTGTFDCAELDRSMAAFAERCAAPERVARVIDEHHLDWTVLGLLQAELRSEGAAREVLYGVRDDGATLEQMSSLARASVEVSRLSVGELTPQLLGLLAGARAGEIVGPVAVGEGWRVIVVAERSEPSTSDEATARRARELLVDRAVRSQASQRVRWLDPIAEPRR